MQRVLVYSHEDEPLFELSPSEVYGLTRRETINGEHALSIRTPRALEKGHRVLTQDNRGRWREHVVYGTTHTHEGSEGPVGEYYCVWSLEPDLMGTHVSAMPGVQNPVLARIALEAALGGTSRWNVGTITNVNRGGASMYDMSGWDAMQVLTKTWGGEIDVTINVSSTGVVSRSVDYYDMQGEQTAKRRFDFGADLRSVRRKMPDGPIFCRISPRGKGEETGGGGYGRKITIEDVNDGKDWLENPSMVSVARLPDGDGGWEYPTLIVENQDMETPQDLKNWALGVLEDYTVPKVTYDVDAVQAGVEGVSVQGVSLGDVVHVVDRKLDDLRVSARVVTIETDMLDELSTKVTLGYVNEPLSSVFAAIQGSMDRISADVSGVKGIAYSTAQYLDNIIDNLNAEINATGGYWYMVPGIGTRTYDVEVSDPAVGAEASKVVEVRGGTIRIADSKTAQGEWEFKTLIQSGHVAAELVTAVNAVFGFIGDASSGTYWDLDGNRLAIGAGSAMGDRSVQDVLDGVDTANEVASDAAKVATNYLKYDSTVGLDVGYSDSNAKTRITGSGVEIFDGAGVSTLFAGLSSGTSIVRIGRASGSGNVVMSSDGSVDVRSSSNVLAHFGYGEGKNSSGGTSIAPYYNIGVRESDSVVGNYSVAEGYRTEAAGYASHAEGYRTKASDYYAHAEGYSTEATARASHAEGEGCEASGNACHAEGVSTKATGTCCHAEGANTVASYRYTHAEGCYTEASGYYAHAEGHLTKATAYASHAEGEGCEATGAYSHAEGEQTQASGQCEHACGRYNISGSNYLMSVGRGTSSGRANAMYLTSGGSMWIAGTLTQNSDRRLKEHHAYLGDDACAFIRSLKPALYTKDGERHVGFYAQDVQEAEPESWDTATVTAQHTDEGLGFDPLTLDYSALIAPLVAYTQQLERRIEELERLVGEDNECTQMARASVDSPERHIMALTKEERS